MAVNVICMGERAIQALFQLDAVRLRDQGRPRGEVREHGRRKHEKEKPPRPVGKKSAARQERTRQNEPIKVQSSCTPEATECRDVTLGHVYTAFSRRG